MVTKPSRNDGRRPAAFFCVLTVVASLSIFADATCAWFDGAVTPAGKVALAVDRKGAVKNVVVSPSGGERVTVTGEAIAFAEGATITFLAPGELEFQNAVTSASDITVIRPETGKPQSLEWRSPNGTTVAGNDYVKIFSGAGTLKDEITVVGFETTDGVYTVVSNRPYAAETAGPVGEMPSCSRVYQMSVGNLWDGTNTKSIRFQLAQPDGTGDIYARTTAYTVSDGGNNVFNSPDPRELDSGVTKYTASENPDVIAAHPVTRIILARKGKGYATVRFRGATDLNGGAVVYKVRESCDAYIQSDGTARINTGYKMKPGSGIEIDYAYTEFQSVSERLFGGGCALVYLSGTVPTLMYGDSLASTVGSAFSGLQTGVRYHTTVTSEGRWIDTLYETGATNYDRTASAQITKEGGNPLYLFGWHNAANYSKAKIYRFTLAENGAVVHDYLPAVKEGIAGFYDEVGGGFIHGGASAGKFTASDDAAALPDDPYIRGDGTSLIVTDFCMATNVAVEYAYAFDEVTSGARILGGGGMINYLSGTSPAMVYGDGTTATMNSGKTADTAKHLVSMTPDGVWTDVNPITGAVNFTKTSEKIITFAKASNPIRLFGSFNSDIYAKARIYYVTFSTNGVVIAKFVPAVVGGVAGFRDAVSGKFYAGATPTAFTAGGAVEHVANESYDPYIQGNGTSLIVTDFSMRPNVAVEYAYAFDEVTSNAGIIGGGGIINYLAGTTTMMIYGDGTATSMSSEKTADTAKHLVSMTPDGVWTDTDPITGEVNFTKTSTKTITYAMSTSIRLFGSQNNTLTPNRAKAKIYYATFSVNGVAAANFVPAEVDGIAGFTDTVGGKFYAGETPSAFSYGCSWREGSGLGAEKFTTVPEDATVPRNETATLTAEMPGADSYEWLKNGEVIVGETGASLAVGWRTGAGSDVYTVRAVRTVTGVTIKSDTVSATVRFDKAGTVILFR